MGGVSNIVGSLTGGLLGGPVVKPAKEAQAQKTNIDPNRGKSIAEAKKAKAAAAGAAGRSSLRIDLAGGEAQVGRSGLRIA
jgi:hypothetical protein